MNKDLPELRKLIDEVDTEITNLLAKRMELVKQVGIYKAERNIPPLDQSRWEEVLKAKREQAKSLGISETFIEDIYNRIHKEALELETKK